MLHVPCDRVAVGGKVGRAATVDGLPEQGVAALVEELDRLRVEHALVKEENQRMELDMQVPRLAFWLPV